MQRYVGHKPEFFFRQNSGITQAIDISGVKMRISRILTLAAITISAGACQDLTCDLSGYKPQEGLTYALRELIYGLSEQSRQIQFSYLDNSHATLRISAEACNHLFRIVQEAVSNSLKHAAAQNIRVELNVDPEWVRVEIRDDGRGILRAANEAGGMGLASMRDRASAIGAHLIVTPTTSHGGTVVQLDCPNLDLEPKRRWYG